jgi:hypothetical protein
MIKYHIQCCPICDRVLSVKFPKEWEHNEKFCQNKHHELNIEYTLDGDIIRI